jgi:uncharacterized C2H2 Zn-finger protein
MAVRAAKVEETMMIPRGVVSQVFKRLKYYIKLVMVSKAMGFYFPSFIPNGLRWKNEIML